MCVALLQSVIDPCVAKIDGLENSNYNYPE